jgi:hypothetical protein
MAPKYLSWALDSTNRVLNPLTNKPFRVGDIYEGRRFKCYVNREYKGSTVGPMKVPMWSREEAFQRRQAKKQVIVKNYMSMKTRNVDGLVTRMLANCRYRCKTSGGTCDITRSWLIDRIREGYVVNGHKVRDFDITHNGIDCARSPWAPSLDRIDSANPNYTESNVQVVPWAVNCARNEFGDDVLVEAVGPYIDFLRQKQNCGSMSVD